MQMNIQAVWCDRPQSEPLRFAAERLTKAMEQWCTPGMPGAGQNIQVKLFAGPAAQWPCNAQPQGYRLHRDGDLLVIAGADEAGAMYGGLDLAQHFLDGGGMEHLPPGVQEPFIKNRGIKLNIPLDARTPSYTDCGDSAQQNIANMWEMDFWQGYLDRMALNKYNVLSLWSLSPFPSLVRTPGYEEVALPDVMRATFPARGTLRGLQFYTEEQQKSLITLKKMTVDEKIAFWQQVMEYAKSRCIRVYLFTWNVHVYGTEHTSYGITDSPANPITCDYMRRSVEALVRTYPLLAGIGITAGENMHVGWMEDVQDDIEWMMDVYGRGVMNALTDTPDRPFAIIHRSHMTSVAHMEQAFAQFPYEFQLSYKYSMAHMYSVEKPHFGDDFFEQLKNGRKTWLTVRNDDFYMLRWGNLAFARAYLQQMPRELMEGFYMGSDGVPWAKEYASRNQEDTDVYYFDRHWFEMAIWGKLSYNIALPDAAFRHMFAARFGEKADLVMGAMQEASMAVPLLQRVFWHNFDFQWYPEACCSHLQEEDRLVFRDLNYFTQHQACPGAGYLSVQEYCEGLCAGHLPEGVTPLEAADKMEKHSMRALELLNQMVPCVLDEMDLPADTTIVKKRELFAQTLEDSCAPADVHLLADIAAMAELGLYYVSKLRAATALLLSRLQRDESQRRQAVAHARAAARHWMAYSFGMADNYRPQRLSRMRNTISPEMFDGDVFMDVLIAENG